MRATTILVAAGVLLAGAIWWWSPSASAEISYRTAAVTRGDLVVTVSATGTVEPEDLVDVGAQVAGRIVDFGRDDGGKPIDYGSAVEENTVLAHIDDSLYESDVAIASASLEQARAGAVRADADLGQLRARLALAQRAFARAEKLVASNNLSEADHDSAQSALEVATADVAVGEAAILQAKATVSHAEATLARAKRNLGYCTIRSPVRGVIIDRRVNIGQTVVSSLNAPSLFLIAKDLGRVQVWVSVNEADIGQITPGMPVTFTVDAFPGVTFRGDVGKIRLNATMTQNIVTYTVEVETDNRDHKLLPYLTANAQFEIRHDPDVLLVPNAALRWAPAEARAAPGARAAAPAAPDDGNAPALPRGTVWVADASGPRPVVVAVGPSDGAVTEVSGEGLSEGLTVIVGEINPEPQEDTTPFAPQPFRRSG